MPKKQPARLITDSELDALEKTHHRIKYVRAFGHEFVFRGPTRTEMRRHQLNIRAGTHVAVEADTEALQFLILRFDANAGQDAVAAWNAFIDSHPMAAASEAIGGAFARLCGLVEDDEEKNWGPPASASSATHANSPVA